MQNNDIESLSSLVKLLNTPDQLVSDNNSPFNAQIQALKALEGKGQWGADEKGLFFTANNIVDLGPASIQLLSRLGNDIKCKHTNPETDFLKISIVSIDDAFLKTLLEMQKKLSLSNEAGEPVPASKNVEKPVVEIKGFDEGMENKKKTTSPESLSSKDTYLDLIVKELNSNSKGRLPPAFDQLRGKGQWKVEDDNISISFNVNQNLSPNQQRGKVTNSPKQLSDPLSQVQALLVLALGRQQDFRANNPKTLDRTSSTSYDNALAQTPKFEMKSNIIPTLGMLAGVSSPKNIITRPSNSPTIKPSLSPSKSSEMEPLNLNSGPKLGKS